MIWIPLIILAAAAFLVAVFLLKLPRSGWTIFGAVLLLGMAGYASQGFPGMAGSPTTSAAESDTEFAAMVDVRREMFGPVNLPSRYVVMADGFTRQGQFEDAAGLLNLAIAENRDDGQAWLALANVLVEHAGGQVTPAAVYAYGKAEAALPAHPGPAYFLGIGMLRSGRPAEARALWAETIANAPDNAPWLPQMNERLQRLDELIAQSAPQ